MSAVGAGQNSNDQVPSPLLVATGPPFGSQPHQGPVKRTSEASPQTVTVMSNASVKQFPSQSKPAAEPDPLHIPQSSYAPTQSSTSSHTPSASASAEQSPPHTPRASNWFPSQSQEPSEIPLPLQTPHSSYAPTQSSSSSHTPSPSTSVTQLPSQSYTTTGSLTTQEDSVPLRDRKSNSTSPLENWNLTERSNATAGTVFVLLPRVRATAGPLFQFPFATVLTTL